MTTKATDELAEPFPADLALGGRPGVSFSRQLRAELRKLTDTRAGMWLLIVIFAVTPVVVVGMLIIAKPRDLTYNQFIDVASSPERIILPILGILTVTTEWSQRTGLLTFTLEPNRKRVLLAKAAATLLLGIAVIAAGFLSAAIGNLLGSALRDGDGSWAFGAAGYRDIALVLLVGLLQGLAYGMLLLSSAAAIVVYYVVPNLSSLLFSAVASLNDAAPWLDLQHAQSALYRHDLTAKSWAQYLTAAMIWVAVPGVIGVARMLRSEVTSS